MFITHADAQIFAVAFGSGDRTLVAIGGWAGNWELWAAPFVELSRTWRTIAYDHRGTGATLAPVASITAEAMVDDLFAVLDAFGVERCVLAAESSGATIALMAALRQPQRFSGLVLVDGLCHHAVPGGPDPFVEALRADLAATMAWFAEQCAPGAQNAAVRHWGRQILGRVAGDAAVQLHVCLQGIDLRQSAAQIGQPTLILHGSADKIVPLSDAQGLAAQIPHSRLQVVDGAGHVPTMTHAEEVAQAINHFFAGMAV